MSWDAFDGIWKTNSQRRSYSRIFEAEGRKDEVKRKEQKGRGSWGVTSVRGHNPMS